MQLFPNGSTANPATDRGVVRAIHYFGQSYDSQTQDTAIEIVRDFVTGSPARVSEDSPDYLAVRLIEDVIFAIWSVTPSSEFRDILRDESDHEIELFTFITTAISLAYLSSRYHDGNRPAAELICCTFVLTHLSICYNFIDKNHFYSAKEIVGTLAKFFRENCTPEEGPIDILEEAASLRF
jgi:hypothetical protein